MKRVIAIQNGQLEMGKNIDAALRAVFSVTDIPEERQRKAVGALPSVPFPQKAEEALRHYNKALEYLKQANWKEYGEELNRIQKILQTMAE